METGGTIDMVKRGVTKYEDPVAEWLKRQYGDYGSRTAEYISLLTEKQRTFCARYLVHGKPSVAAKEAGFTKAAQSKAQHFVNVPKIQAYINLLAAKREVDAKRASAAEMLVRIKATPVLSADGVPLPDEIVKATENLKSGVLDVSDEDLIAHTQAKPISPIMQVPAVKVDSAVSFGPDWVVEQLIRVAERCLQIEPVYDTKGRPIGTFTFQATQALRALELVGKTLALFTDRVEHTPMEQYKGSELDARIQALVGEHPELGKMMGKIDKAAVPKPKAKRTPGQADPDFIAMPKERGRKIH